MKKNTVTLIDNSVGKRYEYNILESTRGPSVVDIRSFFADTGMFTYDPGFTSTASCTSSITFIDGGKGELRYQGIPIEELALDHSYMETCYLLLNEHLPTEEELNDFDLEIRHRAFLHEGLRHLLHFQTMPTLWQPSLQRLLPSPLFTMTIWRWIKKKSIRRWQDALSLRSLPSQHLHTDTPWAYPSSNQISILVSRKTF